MLQTIVQKGKATGMMTMENIRQRQSVVSNDQRVSGQASQNYFPTTNFLKKNMTSFAK